MQRTLFIIPHSILGIPVFGFGWALALLGVALAIWLVLVARDPRRSVGDELRRNGLFWVVAAAAIGWLIPSIEIASFEGTPVGIPVRGYGVLLLLGVAAGMGLALHRARQAAVSADAIFELAFWLFIGGIGGARLFYIVQYWDEFSAGSVGATAARILNFTRGGLVVYGSIIGGTVAMILFCVRHKISPLKMGDIIIPCLFLGIFFGRIGCLMNGCCYGGRCEPAPTALYFPAGSPVYVDQMRSGDLLGLELEPVSSGDSEDESSRARRITAVAANSPAERRGIQPGGVVTGIEMVPPPREKMDPTMAVDETSAASWVAVVNGDSYRWDADELPRRALAVQPAQILSSFNGLWICVVLLLVSRYVPLREGTLMATGFLLYGLVRFGEEIIRTDEPGQFGTELSISQWVSLAVIPAAILLIVYIYKVRPSVPAAGADIENPGTGTRN